MIRRTVTIALVGTLLAACQNASPQMGMPGAGPAVAATAMDGTWASTDGVFVAVFQGGTFTSRFTRTNEVLAQGKFRVEGKRVRMDWLSVSTQQERSAACTMAGADTVHCDQAGGGSFDLKRA